MKGKGRKFISAIASIMILLILFMIGPADAFVIGLSISDTSPFIGEIITLSATAEVEEGEIADIDYFKLNLSGPTESICKFDANGTVIEGCLGLTISRTSSPGFGYGYGYGYGYMPGKFTFEIMMDTSFYMVGKYSTKLIASTSLGDHEISGDNILINEPLKGTCSLRADSGLLTTGEENFTNNKMSLNFRVPKKKDPNGQGYLTGQEKKNRFVYKFRIGNILENNSDRLVLESSGVYRVDKEDEKTGMVLITIDKKLDKINVDEKTGAFNAENMDIGFMRGC